MNFKHKHNYLIILFLGVFVFAISCKTTSKAKQETTIASPEKKAITDSVIKKHNLTNSKTIYNTDSTYAIITSVQLKTPQRPHNQLKYIIYDIKNDKTVYRDAFMDGKVKWSAPYVIEAQYTPGVIKNEKKKEDYGYYFDVKTLKRTEK